MKRCSMNEEAYIEVNENLNRLISVTIGDTNGFDLDCHNLPIDNNVRVVKLPKKILMQIIQDQHPPNILNTLNDDCLIAIFEYLPLSDLCTVADVCQTLKRNAQTSFQLHHRSFNTERIIKAVGYHRTHTYVQMAEQLFRNFGHLIEELCMPGRCLNDKKKKRKCNVLGKKILPLNGIQNFNYR